MKIYNRHNAPFIVEVLDPTIITEPDQSRSLQEILTDYTKGYGIGDLLSPNIESDNVEYDDDDNFDVDPVYDDVLDVISSRSATVPGDEQTNEVSEAKGVSERSESNEESETSE